MQLSELLQTLRRHRVLAGAVLALALVASLAAAFIPAPRYRASATVLVQPDPERLQFGVVQAVEFAMPSFVAAAQSRALADDARLALPAADRQVEAEIRAEAEPGTGILLVVAESTSRALVAPLADAAADELIERQPANGLFTLEILDPAQPPTSPFSPARVALVLSGGVLGLILAVGAPLVLSFARGRLDTADEIRRLLGVTVLGEIPQLSRGIASDPSQLFDKEGDQPRVVEAYQLLRTNLEFALFSRPGATAAITITSCGVGEGKSTLSANLGWVMASSGYEVLLIDADLRRPTLHQYLDVPFEGGVGAAAAVGDVSSLVRSTALPSLGLVPAGVADAHPAEVLGNALPRLLDSHKGPQHLVLVDTPPVNSVAETVIAAAMTTFVVLVVDATRHDPAELERAVRHLSESGAQMLGVIINRTRSRRGNLPDDYYFTPAPELPPHTVPAKGVATTGVGRPGNGKRLSPGPKHRSRTGTRRR